MASLVRAFICFEFPGRCPRSSRRLALGRCAAILSRAEGGEKNDVPQRIGGENDRCPFVLLRGDKGAFKGRDVRKEGLGHGKDASTGDSRRVRLRLNKNDSNR